MYRRHAQILFSAALALFSLFATTPLALAQSSSDEVPARLAYFEGTVTVQRAASGDTEEALVNLPLGSGDRIWSGEAGRVEIGFEDGTQLWLDGRTTLDFVSLAGNGPAILRLWSGSVFVSRVSDAGAGGGLRIDAPSGSVGFERAGLFRVDVDDEQRVWLSAYDGSASLTAGGLAELVGAGTRSFAEMETAPARAASFNTAEADAFGRWRDDRVALYASSRQYVREREYLPKTVVHYAAELEPHGSWGYDDGFRAWYWRPHALVAWTPYRHGRWVYTYGGWSWVPAAPWGWVTTHYGRWHHADHHGWVWFPGSSWSPASVHWYVGPRYVGWVPLNYYAAPAVSFGVHFGGGAISVGFGDYYDYPYYYRYPRYRYPRYYGYAGYLDYRHWDPRFDRFDRFDRDRFDDRRAVDVGPIGSASGTGRIVNGVGYSSGLANAWTVVPAEQFGSANVERAAVARSALPRGLDQGSKALVSGALRARRPDSLIPAASRDNPTTSAGQAGEGRRAVSRSAGFGGGSPAGGANVVPESTPAASPRNPASRRATTLPATGQAQAVRPGAGDASPPRLARPTTDPARRAAPGNGLNGPVVRPQATAPGSERPAAGTVRRAAPRDPAVAPRAGSPTVPGGARPAPTQPSTGRRVLQRSNGAAATPPSGALTPPPAARSTLPQARVRSRPSGAPTAPSVSTSPRPSVSRPASGVSRPSVSRPSSSAPRPSVSRPGSGGSRPSVSRPSSSAPRPSVSRPGSGGSRPSASPPGSSAPRPSVSRPGSGGSRPSAAPRAGVVTRPPSGSPPSAPSRPAPSGKAKARPRPGNPGGGQDF